MKKIILFLFIFLLLINKQHLESKPKKLGSFFVLKEIETNKKNTYLEKLAMLESSNNYKAINKYGYMGKYQFNKKILKNLIDLNLLKIDYKDIEVNNFINNDSLQEVAIRILTAHNHKILRNYGLIKYVGTTINEVEITLNGMLAASHLRGPRAVKKFIESNGSINLEDANNTSVKKYMLHFN